MAIITLSREVFSGAEELARCISEKLDYRLVSREDVIEKTAWYGISADRLDRARRRRLGIFQRMDREWARYVVYLRAALTKEIRQGSLVYLGENGRALLNDFPTLLNIKIVADLEHRIDNMMKRTGYVINRKRARRLIERIDETEAKWLRTLYDDGRDGCSDFDLTVEPALIGVSDACQLVFSTLEGTQYQTTPRSLDISDVLTVAAELRARFAMNEDLVDDNVQVEVRDGVIIVGGSVHSATELNEIKEMLG